MAQGGCFRKLAARYDINAVFSAIGLRQMAVWLFVVEAAVAVGIAHAEKFHLDFRFDLRCDLRDFPNYYFAVKARDAGLSAATRSSD